MSKRKERAVHFLAFVALVANLFAPVFTLPVTAEDLVNTDPVVTMNEADEAEQQRLAEEEAEKQRQAEEESERQRQAEADAAATKAAEDAAATKAAEDAAATKAAEDAAATKAAEDAAATKAAEDEAARVQAEQERLAEEERLKQEEADRLEAERLAEEEAARKQAEEEAAKGDDGVEGVSNTAQNQPKSRSNAPAKSLIPQNPQVVGCGVDLVVTGAAGPAGVVYNVTLNEDGSYTVIASIDPSMVGSHVLNVEGTDWKPNGDVATYIVEAIPCAEMGTMGSGNGHNPVTICHRNGLSGNWQELTLDAEGVVKQGHMEHQDGQDIIPEFVYEGQTYGPRPANAQQIIDNGCNPLATGKPNVNITNATCGPDGYAPSSITISATGFKVLSTNPVAASSSVDADGMGTYTFENENDILVEIRIQVKDNYTYSGNSGWNYEQGSNPFIKYKTFELKGTECEPDLTIEKTVDNPPVYANGISWKITVKNYGSQAEYIRIVETSPDGSTYWNILDQAKYICDDGYSNVGGVYQWECDGNVPQMQNGTPGTKIFHFSSEMAKDCGSYPNTVTLKVRDGQSWTTVNTASSTFVKECPAPDLSIEKELKKPHDGTASSGEIITFNVTVKNHDWKKAEGVTFTDTLPVEFVGAGWTWDTDGCSLDGNIITCGPFDLNGGESRTFAFSANVPADGSVCGEFTNSAQLPSVESSGNNGIQTTSGNHNPTPRQIEDSASVKIKCQPGIKVEKSANKEEVERGESFTYTIKVSNTGDTTLSGFVVTDQLDTNYLSFVSSEGDLCTESTAGSGLVTCDVPTLTPQGQNGATSKTFNITVKVKSDLDPEMCDSWIKNTAHVGLPQVQRSGGGVNSGPVEDTSNTVKTKVKECDPRVEIDKTGPAEAAPGETFDYTLTVTNEGNVPLENYVVTDELDTEYISFVSSELCQESTPGSGEITCTVPVLTPEGQDGPTSQEFVITVQVSIELEPHQCDDQFYNKAFVGQIVQVNGVTSGQHHGDNGGSDSDSSDKVWTSLDDCNPGIEITKTDDVADDEYVLPGGTYTYTITVENTGSIAASSYVMTDPLESYLAFAFAGDLPEGCSIGGQTLTCSVPTMAPGADAWSIQVPVTLVEAPAGEQCDPAYNKAEVGPALEYLSASGSGNDGDEGNTSDYAAETTNVACPDIEVSKKDKVKEPVDPGEAFTYEIKVTNSGNVTLTDIVVEDLLPDGLEVVGWSVVEGVSCDDATLECTIDSLASGASVTLELEVAFMTNLTANMCDGVWNEVNVVGNYGEIDVSDDDDEETTPNCEPDFSFEKHATNYSAEPGDTIEYTITLTNEGNIDIASATITDELDVLPVGYSWTITETGPIECTLAPDGVSLTCDLTGNLIPEASATVTISTEIPDALVLTENGNEWCKPWSNTAYVDGTYSTYELQVPEFAALGNDQVESSFDEDWTDTVFVNCTGILIEKEAPGEVDPGGNITYTITVTNMGNVPVEFQVTDVLDSRLSEVSAAWQYDMGDPLDCSVDAATNTVTCDVLYLASGNSVTITINATVSAEPTTEQCEPIENTANVSEYSRAVVGLVPLSREITIPQGASIPSNPVETTVNCQPDLDLEKSVSVEEDGDIVFTITATNTGSGVAENQTIVDTLPEGLAGLDWDITLNPADTETACGIEEGVVTCEPVFLDQYDGELAITLTAQTDAQYPVCGEYTNVAAMGQLEANAMVSIECVPDYEVEKTSANTDDADENGALSVGDTVTYTVAVTNTGNQDLSGITLDDQFTGAGEGGLTWIAPEGFDGENVPSIAVGGSIDLVATYVITQADVDAGEIENCALMTYAVDDETVINRDDCAEDDIRQNPGVDMEKTGTVSGGAEVLELGNTITYTFTVTNTGNVTIENLEIDDPMEGVEFTGGNTIATLAPGESMELTAAYEVDQGDVNSGMITNCADVAGMAADGTEVADQGCDTKLVDQERNLDVLVAHECPGPVDELLAEGNFEVTYELTIVNNGTVTVHDIVMTTSHEGTLNEPFPTTFEPGQSETRQWTIVATEEEFESGEINVDITVIGKTENGASAMLASMAIQVLDDDVESRLVLTCPIDAPVEPDTDTTPKPEKVASVVDLPNTGSGHIASTASVLWAAAMLSVFALGASAVAVRRRW